MELLVVIGIISVLIAILMPAMQTARQHAVALECMNNMRQIGTAMVMYVGEMKGYLPPNVPNSNSDGFGEGVSNFANNGVWNGPNPNFLGSMQPYLSPGPIFYCPSLGSDRYYFGLEPTSTSDTNYMGNAVFMGKQPAVVPDCSDLIVLQEWDWRSNIAWFRPGLDIGSSPAVYFDWHSTYSGPEEYSNVHFNGGNLLFLDGHAEWRPYKELHASDFGLTGGPGLSGNATDGWNSNYGYSYASPY